MEESLMVKQYAIEEAGRDFAAVVEEAEHGARIEVTRGGRPVAVLLRLDVAERKDSPASFWMAYQALRQEFDFETLGIDPDGVFAEVRDTSPGRDLSW
jgi:prevent-host-death family protein